MNIKKVDDKPMVIHTKEKMKPHIRSEPEAKIKGRNVLMVEIGPKVAETDKEDKSGIRKASAKKAVRSPMQKENGMYAQMQKSKQDKEKAISKKNSTVGSAASVGAMTALDQMEGGNEVYESYQVARTLSVPAESAENAGRRLYRSQVAKAHEKKIKRVQAGQKIGKKVVKANSTKTAKLATKRVERDVAKETAKTIAKEATKASVKVVTSTATTTAGTAIFPGVGTAIGVAAGYAAGVAVDYKDMQVKNRNRKLKFFLDKLNSEEQQKDSFVKLVKDLALSKVSMMLKTATPIIGMVLLLLALLVAIVVLPVILIITVIYNSPFAIFFPSISSGDTIQNVLSAYVTEFNSDVNAELTNYSGYDTSEKIYVDFEGADTPDNYYDILAVYIVKHGNGDTATDMTDKANENMKAVFDDMCNYSISSRTDTKTDDEGNTTTTTVKEVKVALKTYRDMISEYGFNAEEQEMIEELMKLEYLIMIGYTGGGQPGETLSPEQYQTIVNAISDANGKKVVEYALSKVGYPYSQDYRDSGAYYDCSSLAYYAWQSAGANLMYEGANTAASEGKFCYDNNYLVSYDEIQPGDLIFYSYSNNGRFCDITHVAIYVGGGKVVEAVNESIGVVYRPVQNQSSIVFIGRPR